MLSKCLILWIGYFAASSNANTVPSWLKPCPVLDSKCAIKNLDDGMLNLANGDAGLGTPPIDPLHIKDTEASSGSLKIKFRNVILYHLSKCKFETFTWDLDKSMVSTTAVCPIVMEGEYNMTGSIIGMPMLGDGDFYIGGGSILAKIDLYLKTVIKDGKTYYKLTRFDHKFEPISKFKLIFNGLNKGDKQQAEAIAKFVDAGWKELMLNFGSPIMTECMLTLADVLNKVLRVMSDPI